MAFVFRVFGTSNRRSRRAVNTLFVQMGQFIDHDLTLTPEEEAHCCERDEVGELWVWPEKYRRDVCIPIKIPEDDKTWAQRGRTCFDVRRYFNSSFPRDDVLRSEKREEIGQI